MEKMKEKWGGYERGEILKIEANKRRENGKNRNSEKREKENGEDERRSGGDMKGEIVKREGKDIKGEREGEEETTTMRVEKPLQ